MATVTAADEALSSCSQNAAYSATIMAAQIRSAKAQVESGNPAMVAGRPTLCTRANGASPDFLDHRDRRGHICGIQQSPLAGEDLANFGGVKAPAACMTRGSHTSRLAGREG